MIIKICGITNREDALAAVEAGATALGFNFYPRSPRYITPAKAAEISRSLPGDILRVGVFVNETPAAVRDVVFRASLDVAQLHGDCRIPSGIRAWKALAVGAEFRPERLNDYSTEAFVLDTPAGTAYGGTGRSFDWRLVIGIPNKIILAGGLDAGNVAEAIRIVHPWGVDACSRLESAPGKKDHRKMAAFIQAALAEQTS